mmetsp:Transcript_81269/g.169831  ORF Transcript_81269/g.169831 Transcript_81269/m.169831 type:complete len:96 (-) Transcript_81269:3634-3921(-)
MTRPAPMTMIWSESWMVLNRWAIVKVVRPALAVSRAACTTFSEVESRAEVASSKRRIFGFLIKARAMAQRCFWPPESLPPLLPTVSVQATLPFRT